MDPLPTSTLILSAVAGGLVGVLSGLFGVGGGFLLVPLLNTVLGVPMPIAVGSTTCYTLGPATTALLARRPTTGYIELPLILAGGLFAGVFAGATALSSLQRAGTVEVFGRLLPAVDVAVLGCYSVLMTGIVVSTLLSVRRSKLLRHPDGPGIISRCPIPPTAFIPDLTPSTFSIPLLSLLGFGVGCLSGFLGMSGGLVLIPATVFLLGLSVHDATTITVVIVWIASCQACVMHALQNRVDLWLTGALLVTGPLGARLGAEAGMRLPGRQLKIGFAMMVLVAAIIVWGRLWTLVVR